MNRLLLMHGPMFKSVVFCFTCRSVYSPTETAFPYWLVSSPTDKKSDDRCFADYNSADTASLPVAIGTNGEEHFSE